jgi:hypothetical protein
VIRCALGERRCVFLGFDPPHFPVRLHATSRGANELFYAFSKATEAPAPAAAEASTAAPSRRIGGTRFAGVCEQQKSPGRGFS